MPPKTCRIIRKSTITLLQNYEYFTSTPTLLAFPYAASYLLAQSLAPSSPIFPTVEARLKSLFLAARFPSSLRIFATINLKLSQTLTIFLFVSPFTFTFLLLSKATVIVHQLKPKPSSSRTSSIFVPLLITQLCNSLVTLAANATCFFFFALCSNFLEALGLSSGLGPLLLLLSSSASVLIYCIAVAKAYIVCNLASASSGMESRGGLISIVKACGMIQGGSRTAAALSLAVAMNLGFAGIEALFQYRVVRGYSGSGLMMFVEGVFIAFVYALFLVVDTVVVCVFWRSCKEDDEHIDDDDDGEGFCFEIAENKLKGLDMI